MKNYVVESNYMKILKSATKGTQVKYEKDGYWYKINKNGNEGLAEYLVSLLLVCSTLKQTEYVAYEYCRINNKMGCRSKSFNENGYEFVSFHLLYMLITGKENLSDYLYTFDEPKDRLQYLLEIAETFHVPNIMNYMKKILYLDMLIANHDRHMSNIGILLNSNGEAKTAPIFDNGLSLGTDGISTVTSCTISGSFEQQILAFGYPIESPFLVDYDLFYEKTKDISCKELEFLLDNMKKYEDIFRIGEHKVCSNS
ncbi:MAG: hypothetical protein IJA32_04350 [Lachnospiraceae bacterium]|nr:hypothetical protein [Lachnospiraceae bacterium]